MFERIKASLRTWNRLTIGTKTRAKARAYALAALEAEGVGEEGIPRCPLCTRLLVYQAEREAGYCGFCWTLGDVEIHDPALEGFHVDGENCACSLPPSTPRAPRIGDGPRAFPLGILPRIQ